MNKDKKEENVLKVLYRLWDICSTDEDLKESFRKSLDCIAHELGIAYCFLFVKNSHADNILLSVNVGWDENAKTGLLPSIEGIYKEIFCKGKPLLVFKDGFGLKVFNETFHNIDRRSLIFLSYPIYTAGKVVGAIGVERIYDNDFQLEEDFRFLNIFSLLMNTMIKQKLELEKGYRNPFYSFDCVPFLLCNNSKPAMSAKAKIDFERVIEEKLSEIITAMEIKEDIRKDLYSNLMSRIERILLKIALARMDNKKVKAAQFLGINRNTLQKKLKWHNLETKDFNNSSTTTFISSA
ncbi:MAG: helix-turn-helix domain-containing protein [Thermodesulfobacteriota bacterium]|nr:helix-turn-helix domain-containing protein [Thermodesulfobacteriota bacterium]